MSMTIASLVVYCASVPKFTFSLSHFGSVFSPFSYFSPRCLHLFLPPVRVATPASNQPSHPNDSPTPGPDIFARSWRGNTVTRRYLVSAQEGIASALVIRRREVLQTVNSNGRPKFKNYSTAVVPWDDKEKLLQVLLNQLLVSISVIGTQGGGKRHTVLTTCDISLVFVWLRKESLTH